MDQKSEEGPVTKTLIKTETAWDRSALPDYPVGKPEIIIDRINI